MLFVFALLACASACGAWQGSHVQCGDTINADTTLDADMQTAPGTARSRSRADGVTLDLTDTRSGGADTEVSACDRSISGRYRDQERHDPGVSRGHLQVWPGRHVAAGATSPARQREGVDLHQNCGAFRVVNYTRFADTAGCLSTAKLVAHSTASPITPGTGMRLDSPGDARGQRDSRKCVGVHSRRC